MDGSILSYTRSLAEELAHEFRGDPEAELEMWTTTAQQREAMVVMLYDSAAIARRLPPHSAEPEVLSVVRKAIGGIWAQERSHTTLVEALRVLDETRLTAARSVLGAIEGRVTHHATANSWTSSIASFLIGLGRGAGFAPEFTKAFHSLTPGQFFRFSHELEITAKEGYARILELLELLELPHARHYPLDADSCSSAAGALKFGVSAPHDFAKIHAEECFHAAVFAQFEAWLESDGKTFQPQPAHSAILRLRALVLEHLSPGSRSFGPVAQAVRDSPWTKSPDSLAVVSHGGLGDLLEEYGLALPLVSS